MTSPDQPTPAVCPARTGGNRHLMDAAFPHEAFPTAIRDLADTGPVHPVVLPGGLHTWLVTDHHAARALAGDQRLTLDIREIPEPPCGLGRTRYPEDGLAVRGRHLMNIDGADHDRLRRQVSPLLSHAAVQPQRPMIEAAAENALRDLAGQDPADVVAHYARPLASDVMSTLLGVPADLRAPLADVTARLGEPDPPDSEPMHAALLEQFDLVREAMERRRTDPGDDLITVLLKAHGRDRITRMEIQAMISLLTAAGLETTATLIAYGTALLIEHPDIRRTLLTDDDSAQAVVEELLRHHAPLFTAGWRFTTEPVEVGDTTIPAGAFVLLSLAAANKDPGVFPHPDDFRTDRPNAAQLMSFGHGPHYCLGSHLGRLEGRIALRALFRRYPSIALATEPDALTWQGATLNRRLTTLPVTLGTARQRP
ncbi:cytochrome P450 [Streptomyces uncialis]|uniref:cytochrome P450 n=1 Tax=Streptomyces uncialis TaxID=1048205 RepID=UPI0037BCFD08